LVNSQKNPKLERFGFFIYIFLSLCGIKTVWLHGFTACFKDLF